MSKEQILSVILFIGLTFTILSSCHSGHIPRRERIEQRSINLNQYIVDDFISSVPFYSQYVYINPILQYRDYITLIELDRISKHHGVKAKWECVLEEPPNQSTIQNLPTLPDSILSIVHLTEQPISIDKYHQEYICYSPVFETKEKGIYAFHKTITVFLTDDNPSIGITVIRRYFIRFKIINNTVEWLDCYGMSTAPFDY